MSNIASKLFDNALLEDLSVIDILYLYTDKTHLTDMFNEYQKTMIDLKILPNRYVRYDGVLSKSPTHLVDWLTGGHNVS